MKHRSIPAGLLAAALLLSLPAMATSKERGEGRDGRGDRGRSEWKRGNSRGEARGNDRGGTRWRGSQPGDPARGEVGDRVRQPDRWHRGPTPNVRDDRRWNGGGDRAWNGGGDRTWNRGGDRTWNGGAPRRVAGYNVYREPVTRYRGTYPYYRPHNFYYTGYFSRPRFVYRSGISIGFAINLTPSYGYSYYDPYCRIGFRSLGAYYDHCEHLGHSEAILMMYGGSPIATCVYDDGDWVVDDCYDE